VKSLHFSSDDLSPGDLVDGLRRNYSWVEHRHSALGNRTEPKLGVAGHAEFPYDDDVERAVQRSCYNRSHRHTASGQCDDNSISEPEALESCRKVSACIVSVIKRLHIHRNKDDSMLACAGGFRRHP
jgi:hypothetical protein